MFPTKDNFKGRWSMKSECEFCHEIETDVHLFLCVGYGDMLHDIPYNMFMLLEDPMEVLSVGAKQLLMVMNRLECINVSNKQILITKYLVPKTVWHTNRMVVPVIGLYGHSITS